MPDYKNLSPEQNPLIRFSGFMPMQTALRSQKSALRKAANATLRGLPSSSTDEQC